MSGIINITIPYESLDALTIGSCDDPSMVDRETILADIPWKNLWAWI